MVREKSTQERINEINAEIEEKTNVANKLKKLLETTLMQNLINAKQKLKKAMGMENLSDVEFEQQFIKMRSSRRRPTGEKLLALSDVICAESDITNTRVLLNMTKDKLALLNRSLSFLTQESEYQPE